MREGPLTGEAGGTDCPGAYDLWGWVARPGLAGQGCGLLGT